MLLKIELDLKFTEVLAGEQKCNLQWLIRAFVALLQLR